MSNPIGSRPNNTHSDTYALVLPAGHVGTDPRTSYRYRAREKSLQCGVSAAPLPSGLVLLAYPPKTHMATFGAKPIIAGSVP